MGWWIQAQSWEASSQAQGREGQDFEGGGKGVSSERNEPCTTAQGLRQFPMGSIVHT